MNTQFYKPTQGDTAATVTDGYNDNFRILDTAQEAATSAADAALKAHADKAEIHQTSEQIRAEIVDADIPATLARLAAVDAKDAATLTTAKTYTDTQETAIRTDFAAADATALTTSKTYTDTKVAALVDGAPETLDTLKEVAEALKANEDGAAAMMEVIGTKADAATTAAAIAAKVDKVDGKGLSANDYTDADLAKLAGIAEGASNYILPTATVSVLGGIKIGNNLTIDADGRLNAPAGGSGGGGGNSILVLPYVAVEKDAAGNITNSAAFVAAWGSIISQYLAAPNQYALYAEVDVSGGEEMVMNTPCNMLNMGSPENPLWILSGFMVFNVTDGSTKMASCKISVSAMILCSTAGEMQSVATYNTTGIVDSDGQPNLLLEDDPVIIHMDSNTDIPIENRKAELQPVVEALQLNPNRRVMIRMGTIMLSASATIYDNDFVIVSLKPHPLTSQDPNSTLLLKIAFFCRLSNGVIQTVQGGIKGFEVVTTEAMNAALAEKAPLLDYTSLEEQIVPGEFWLGVDGVKRQVYVRAFAGTTPTIDFTILYGISDAQLVTGGISSAEENVILTPPGFIMPEQPDIFGVYWTYYVGLGALNISRVGSTLKNKLYSLTFKYTKV